MEWTDTPDVGLRPSSAELRGAPKSSAIRDITDVPVERPTSPLLWPSATSRLKHHPDCSGDSSDR
jgi:hypothetical protein